MTLLVSTKKIKWGHFRGVGFSLWCMHMEKNQKGFLWKNKQTALSLTKNTFLRQRLSLEGIGVLDRIYFIFGKGLQDEDCKDVCDSFSWFSVMPRVWFNFKFICESSNIRMNLFEWSIIFCHPRCSILNFSSIFQKGFRSLLPTLY